MLASDILTRVRTTLMDPDKTRWTDAELLRWLSDGQRVVATAIPGAAPKRVKIALEAGTRQEIPADCHMLINILRNVTSGGQPGRAVRVGSREVLDAFNPDWHADPAAAVVRSYTYDPSTPDTFYVSPPNDGTGHVETICAETPADLTTLDSQLTVRAPYQQALVDYVLYRAHQKDDDYATVQAASGYLQTFLAQIGGSAQGEAEGSPNRSLGPDVVQRGGVA